MKRITETITMLIVTVAAIGGITVIVKLLITFITVADDRLPAQSPSAVSALAIIAIVVIYILFITL